MTRISDLLDVNFVQILSYLRARDLASVSQVDKNTFSPERVHDAIEMLIRDIYNLPNSSPVKKGADHGNHRRMKPQYLYDNELRCISAALFSAPPLGQRGFWISTTWLSAARKYFGTLEVIQANKKLFLSHGTKNKPKNTRKRDIEVLPPCSSMSSLIMCEHGGLSVPSISYQAKRKVINSRMWHFLRRFFPDGPEFKCAVSTECVICTSESKESKAAVCEKKEAVLAERIAALVPSSLTPLLERKSGVPMHCVTSRVVFYSGMTGEGDSDSGPPVETASVEYDIPLAVDISPEDAAAIRLALGEEHESATTVESEPAIEYDTPPTADISPEDAAAIRLALGEEADFQLQQYQELQQYQQAHVQQQQKQHDEVAVELLQPLIPGLYNLVPRKWLKAWRHYVKDASSEKLPHLDCTDLICQAHGQLVVPPHVTDYLLGVRRGLLTGLGGYEGVMAEIISADEWDTLQEVFRGAADFNVRFCLDGSAVIWSIGVCTVCDPFTYHNVMSKTGKKKSGGNNAQPNSGSFALP